MSLSQFLRNYLYIPLGGNRHGQFRRYRNLILTMLLGGLWHGANWTFVVWGGLHGLYLCIQHGWQSWRKGKPARLATAPRAAVATFACRALTFVAVMIAWGFFRAPDVSSALQVMAGMAGLNGIAPVTELDGPGWFMLAAGAMISFLLPNTNQLFAASADRQTAAGLAPVKASWSPGLGWGVAIGLIFALCLLSIDKTQDFIYAQF
jgi:D-alanyl-lipoteichoic acid acyltransferase DltB (MBOAT superfamily)